jgi:hypothetical protein
MGRRRPAAGAHPAATEEQELAELQQRTKSIEEILEELKSRIRNLDWPPETEK